MSRLKDRAGELFRVLDGLNVADVERATQIIRESIERGGKVLIAGNGGSAAQASHFATELVVRYRKYRKPIPAIALTTDTSILTAASNDFSFEQVFERQVEALGREGDVLFAISTSGRSENVNRAVRKAKEKGMKVIYLSGEKGTPVEEMCDVIVKVPSRETSRIQEAHIFIIHHICEEIENAVEGQEEENQG